MANENESTVRVSFNSKQPSQNDRQSDQLPSEDDTSTTEDQRSTTTDTDHQETDDQRIAREAEERAEQLREIDETEISQTHKTSALYRRAVSDFDPTETEPQLAEHWVETDDELERFGYF